MNISETNATAIVLRALRRADVDLNAIEREQAAFLAQRAAKPLLLTADAFWPAEQEVRS